MLDHNVYSSTVKGISVKNLHVIAHQQKLKQLCGDMANAFVNAYTNKKVYAVAGLEFGEEVAGQIVIMREALYGLASSTERWHAHFADTLQGLGFEPTRYNNYVWIRSSRRYHDHRLMTRLDHATTILQETYVIGEKKDQKGR
jgi:hypothetical protein